MPKTYYTLLAWSLECPPLYNQDSPALIEAHREVCGHWDAWVTDEDVRPSLEALTPTLTRLVELAHDPALLDDAVYFYALAMLLHQPYDGLDLFSRYVKVRPDSPYAADAWLWIGDISAMGCGGVSLPLAAPTPPDAPL